MKRKRNPLAARRRTGATSAAIHRRLRADILARRRAPGERLVEGRLAAAFAASRTPVREALNRLHQEGLVELTPNHGAHVRKFSLDEIIDLSELRLTVEPLVCRKAAERATPDDLRRLRQAADHYRQATDKGDRGLQYIAEDEFHRCIYKATHSAAFLPDRLYALSVLAFSARPSDEHADGKAATESHCRVCELIAKGDGEGAAQVMAEHLRHPLDNLRRMRRSLEAVADMEVSMPHERKSVLRWSGEPLGQTSPNDRCHHKGR